MADQNVFKIKKIIREILGDKFSDALVDPKQTLRDIPYEHLSLMLQKIPQADYQFLAEEIDKDNMSLYEVLIAARDILDTIANRMSGFSSEQLNKKADKYFTDLGLPSDSDAGSRDLSDLKRLIIGNRGNFFSTDHLAKHFLTGDIMEKFFDSCLDEFKKSRSQEFVDVVLKAKKAA